MFCFVIFLFGTETLRERITSVRQKLFPHPQRSVAAQGDGNSNFKKQFFIWKVFIFWMDWRCCWQDIPTILLYAFVCVKQREVSVLDMTHTHTHRLIDRHWLGWSNSRRGGRHFVCRDNPIISFFPPSFSPIKKFDRSGGAEKRIKKENEKYKMIGRIIRRLRGHIPLHNPSATKWIWRSAQDQKSWIGVRGQKSKEKEMADVSKMEQ